MKYLKYIILVVVLAIVLLLCVFIFKLNDAKDDPKETTSNINKSIDFFNTTIIGGELINMLIQPGSDWSKLPLTEHFKTKFDSKYGVLGDIKADKIELDPYVEGTFSFDNYSYILVTKGKKQTAYIYHLDEKHRMWDDFWLTQTYEITDEFGNKLDAVSAINEKTFGVSFRKLAWGEQDEESVAVTSHFHKKYPYFLDLFIHYSPIYHNHIEFVEERSSWDKKEAYFIVDSKLECKKRYYLVEFTLDDKGYLDDVVVHMVNEEEYEGNSNNRSVKLLYSNSNWDNLKITDNYRTKYNNTSYNPDIADIDIDYQGEEEYVEKGNYNEYLRRYRMKNGQYTIYYVKYISSIDDYEYLDDILCEKLDYGNISLEDAKIRFLSDKN